MNDFFHRTHNRFAVEGLESRILLSAVPMDAVMEVEEPTVYEVQYVTEAVTGESEDSLWQGASELTTEVEDAIPAVLLINADGVFDASGELISALEPGMELQAGVVRIADGSVLESISLRANSIELGQVTWLGDNTLSAASLAINAVQTAVDGASLVLQPLADEAPIALGNAAAGVEFVLDATALARLSAAGFAQLTVGSEVGRHNIIIDGLAYEGDLTLRAPLEGGVFNVLSEIRHSGGTLTYIGTGLTQNTSADTQTQGVPIEVNDSVQLVYTEENDNTIRMDTTFMNNPQGADISITGSILGTGVDGGGTLILNAGTTGTILIGGNIGTSEAIKRIVIENAGQVIIEGNVQAQIFEILNGRGDVTFGTSASNFVRIQGVGETNGLFSVRTENNITINGDLELPLFVADDPEDTSVVIPEGNANFDITGTSGTRQLWIKGEVDVGNGDLTIVRAGRVLMSDDVFVSGTLSQATGLDNTRFEQEVSAAEINLRANNQIRFGGGVTLLSGDLTLITNNIDFRGGNTSVVGALSDAGLSISNAYFRPISPAGEMNIGSPLGAGSNFTFSATDIAALQNGWNSIVFGHASGSTNLARIGGATFLDAVTVYAGSMLVNGSLAARTSLTLDAATGNMSFTNGALTSVVNEQVANVWQESFIEMTAHQGDILFSNGAFVRVNNTANPGTGTPASAITMTATQGQIRDQSSSPGFQEARNMHLTAAGDIFLYTRAQNLWAHSTVEGDITVFELDGLHVHSAVTQDGAILIDTGGLTRVDLAESVTDSADNTIEISALGSIRVGQILAGNEGDVTLLAEDDIIRVPGLADVDHRIVANLLTMTAETGIGQLADPLLIRTNALDAENLTSGHVRITHDGQRDALTVQAVNHSTDEGDLLSLDVLGADVTVLGFENHADGGVYLEVLGDLLVAGEISSAAGAVRVSATGAAEVTGDGSILSNGGDIAFIAQVEITMAVVALVASSAGNIALGTLGNILLGVIDGRDNAAAPGAQSAWGDVAIVAGGWLRDHLDSSVVNIHANELQLSAQTGIGQLPDSGQERTVEIDARLLAAEVAVSGDIALRDSNALITGVASAFTFDLLDESGGISAGSLGMAPLAGIANNGGGSILLSAAGSLILQSNAATVDASALVTTGAGDIALLANALTIEDAVLSNGGAISVDVVNAITIGTGVTVGTNGTGTIAMRSSAGSISAAADSVISSAATAIVLSAANNITLGSVSAPNGRVGLIATSGAVTAAAGGVDSRTVIDADSLAIIAGGSVNGVVGSADPLRISVNVLSVTGGSGANYRFINDKSLTIDTTSASASLFNTLMATDALAVAPQSHFIVSGSGNIEVEAEGDLSLAAVRSIRTGGAGNISLVADGSFIMDESSEVENENGTIDILAGNLAAIARVASVDGAVSVESQTSAIVDSTPHDVGVTHFTTSGQLTLTAVSGIGIQSGMRDTLRVELGTLSASTVNGGIFISSANSFTLNGIATAGTSVPVSIVSGGTLTVTHTVDATGDVVLRAADDFVQSNTSSISAGADIALAAGGDMTLKRVVTPTAVALEVEGALMGYANPTVAAVEAAALLLNGVGSVGSPTQPLLTHVDRLAGSITDGTLALNNQVNLTIGEVVVETTPVGSNDSLPQPLRIQTGDRLLVEGSGSGVFLLVEGSFTTESVSDASLETVEALPVLIQSTATQTWNGRFALGGGPITLRAAAAILLDANETFATGGGSLLIQSAADFGLAADSTIARAGGNWMVDAGGNIVIAGAATGSGKAALLSGDAILVGANNFVQASDLILRSAQGIASATQALQTEVERLAVRGGASGVYLNNTGDLAITNLGFGMLSLAAGAVENAVFTGFIGGVVTAQGGAIVIDNDGEVSVDTIAATFDALAGTNLAFSLIADEAGSIGNGIGVFIVRDDPDFAPLTVVYGEEDQSLVIYIQNGVTTMGEIIDLINDHPEFPATAVLAGGRLDGSTVFSLPVASSSGFLAGGGSEDGMRSEVAGALSGGAEPIAASSQLLVADAFFTIRVTSDEAGATINNVTIRLLNEGPLEVADGGRLNPGTDAAIIEWDGSQFLDIYINYGFTTVGTVINRINSQEDIPFSAQLGGTFSSADFNVVLGDASVLMESNLRASAILRPIGPNNDIEVIATTSGPLFNGISFVFLDDGTIPEQGALATFNPVTNVMTIRIQSGLTTANQVVAALNTQGTFTAAIVPELDNLNNGNGPIQAQRFLTTGGAVAVQATATLQMVGSNNDVTLTAKQPGDDFNNIEIRFVANTNASPGSVAVAYNSDLKRLTLTVNPLFTSAAQVVDAINGASTPFTATSNGSGTFALAQYPVTSGGTGSVARAEFIAAGDNNDFSIVANSDSTAFINTRVFLIDDGTITDGTATATYLSGPRHLIINLQSGVTTANTVLAAINDSSIPMTATLLDGNNGTGVYHVGPAVFAGGVDPISATANFILPSGAEAVVTADVGGIAANDIKIAFAIDSSLAADSASAFLFEENGKRILQLRVDSESTTLSALQAALADNEAIPFSLSGDLSAPVGALATTTGAFNEGAIQLSAAGNIHLIGRIDSQTGQVIITTTNSDLTFDSSTARIYAIDGVAINVSGSFANLASLEAPLIKVFAEAMLSITTGSQSLVSSESVYLLSGGDILITGAGFAVEDGFIREQSIRLEAQGDVTIDAPVRSIAVAENAAGITFTLVKSVVDGNDQPLSEANPVAISEVSGNYIIYALPGVATHADIVAAINALDNEVVALFFAELGRQDGTLTIGGHSFFITSLTDAVITTVTIGYADLEGAPVQATFAGTTLTLLFGERDNATVEDVLNALNGLSAFATSTSTLDTSVFLRGDAARDFDGDYTIEVVADPDQSQPVILTELGDTFTLSAIPGTATRLDLLNALTASGLFAGSVPVLDARLTIDDFTFYLNTGRTLNSVSLSVGFVAEGTVELDFNEATGALAITLNNVDAPSGAEIAAALEELEFGVFSLANDLADAVDTASASASLEIIPVGTRTGPLALDAPLTITLPVGEDGVFADVLFDVEGMLIALNWLVPVVASNYTVTTFADSLSATILDDASGATAELAYGAVGVYASTILTIDGVTIAIEARSAELDISAGGAINITASGLLGGGRISADAGGSLDVHGIVEGGTLSLEAEDDITQSGTIRATGTGSINLLSHSGDILMSGSASTTSESGNIFYQAAGDVALVAIASTNAARLDVVSGGAISDALNNSDLNLATDGFIALTAQMGIGAIGSGALNTHSGTIQLRNFGNSGDIVIVETAAGGDLVVSELTQNAANGWSLLDAQQGDVIFTGSVTHLSDGSLRVVASGSIHTHSTVNLQGGLITFLAGNAIALNASINTHGGDAWLDAANGGITMIAGMTLNTLSGNVRLAADGDIMVAQVSTSGDIRAESANGSILRAALNYRTNWIASTLQLFAGVSLGSLASAEGALISDVSVLAATAASGVLALRERNNLTIASNSLTVAYALADRSTSSDDFDQSRLIQSGAGNAALRVGGALTVDAIADPLPAVAIAGNFHLNATGAVTFDGSIVVANGSAQLQSGASFTLNDDLSVNGGTLLVQSGGAFTQAADTQISVNDADTVIQSTGSMTVASIDTGSGDLALISGSGLTQQGGELIESAQLRLSAGGAIASAANPLTFDSDRLAAVAGGAMFLRSESALTVDTVAAIEVDTVTAIGAIGAASTTAALSDLTTTANNGAIILQVITGDLNLNGGLAGPAANTAVSAHGSGNVLLQSVVGAIAATADIRSGSGNISVLAANSISFAATADVLTSATATIDIGSATGLVAMDNDSRFVTGSGDIRVAAAQSITVGGISTTGSVALLATAGSIIDGGDLHRDVIANGLTLVAGNGIGSSTNALDISVNTLSARAHGGGIFIAESNGLTIDNTSATVHRVGANAALTPIVVATQSDLRTLSGNGSIVVELAAGNLVLNDGSAPADSTAVLAHGSGNILLRAANGTLTANADVRSTSGHISLRASGALTLADEVVVATTGSGSITLLSSAGTITQEINSEVTAVNGDIIFEASGTIRIATIETNSNVGLISTSGSILNNDPAALNVLADSLKLRAGVAIGSGSTPIKTHVNAVSAAALGGGLFLSEIDAITVTATSAETSVVLADGSTELKTLAAQTGLASNTSGANVLISETGSITIAAGNTVTAAVNGRVLLDAATDLSVNANISSGAGSITLVAGNDFNLAADITVTTGISGQILVLADGAINTAANSRFINADGNVLLSAADDIVLGGIQSSGRVALMSDNGSVLRAGSDSFNREVIGSQLLLSAANGTVGTNVSGEIFRTQVARVAAVTADGLYMTNAAALRVDAVTVPFRAVNADGSLAAEASVSLTGAILATATDSEIRLTVETQNLTLGNLSAESVFVRTVTGSILDGGYSPTQIIATNAELIAASAIGAAGAGKLDTQIDLLAASAGTNLYLSNNKSLIIGTVGTTSGLSATTTARVEASGSITLNQAFSVTQNDALLNALGGNLTLNASVTSGRDLSLLSSANISQNANVSAGRTLDIEASGGAFSMLNGVTATAVGNARVVADTSILLGGLTAANASLTAGDWIDTAGSTHLDISANGVQLSAGSFIGQAQGEGNGPLRTSINSLAASADSGSIYLSNNKSLSIDSVAAIAVNRVQIDGTSAVISGTTMGGLDADGVVKIALAGSLTLNSAITASADDLLLHATAGSITLNAAVVSGGSITILASTAVSLGANSSIIAAGSLDLQASSGAVGMSDGATATSTGNMRILASGDIRLGGLVAANAYLNAGGAIIDNGDSHTDIQANQIQLVAAGAIGQAQGSGFGLLDIDANALAAQAGAGVFITNAGALQLTTIAPINVNRIGMDSSSSLQTGISLSGITAAGAVIVTAGDSLTVSQSVTTSTAGNVLLEARADAADLAISAPISSVGGNISLLAGRNISLAGTGNVTVFAAPGTIDLQARTGNIEQAAGLTLQTTNANILQQAAVDVRLGIINAGTASVGIVATSGSILDNKARTASTPNNVTANALSMIAGGNIGLVGAGVDNAIETQVNTLSATTTVDGSIHICEFSSLAIDTVAAFSVNRVALDNATTSDDSSMAARSDVRTAGNGHIILRAVSTITLNGGLAGDFANTAVSASGLGNVLIEVLAINGDIQANAQVLAESGNISMLAGRAISFAGNANIIVASGAGTIDLNAARGNITQASTLHAQTAGGNILFRARDNIQLGVIDARSSGDQSTWGLVGLIASTGAITDAKSRTATAVNIFASAANLTAGTGIGVLGSGIDNAIETELLTLAVVTTTSGAINIREASALSIDTVATFTVNRVAIDATIDTTNTTVAARSDLRTAGNGAIVLRVNSGNLTFNGGLAGAGQAAAIVAAGSGGIRLEALDGTISANANVQSGSGHITLRASSAINLNSNVAVTTSGTGNIALEAVSGAISMAPTASISAPTAVARLAAAGDLTLATITSGSVSLIASTGSISTSLTSGTNVTATNLRIAAAASIGTSSQAITTAIDNLSASSAAGSIYISESNGITVRDVAITTTSFNVNGTTTTVADVAQSDLTTGASGDIVLTSTLGNIILTDGTNANGIAVSANGSGTVTIEAAAGQLLANAAIMSGAGEIDLTATQVEFAGAISTDADITISATNGGIFRSHAAAAIDAGTGSIDLSATSGIGRTGSGALSLSGSSVTIDNTLSGSVYVNLLTAATIEGISLAGRGDLYLNQLDHAMIINGAITVEDGRMILLSRQAITVNADLDTGTDIRLTGDSLNVAAGVNLSATGDILLRAQNAIVFDVGSSVDAGANLTAIAGTDLTTSTFTAGDRMDLRARNSILRADGILEAPFMRLLASEGSLGAADNELLLKAGRLDVSAGGPMHLIHEGDITIGRAGLVTSADEGETIAITVQSGTLTSNQGEIRLEGSGTLLLDIDGELVLGRAIVALDGNITIITDKLSASETATGVMLQAVNGRVSITSVSGIGKESGAGAEIVIAANEFTAITYSGSLNVVLEQATRIVGPGVQINSGSGSLKMAVNSGSLTVDAPIRQMGSGLIDLNVFSGNLWVNDTIRQNSGGSLTARVHNGNLTMNSNGRIETTSGAMNLRASGDVWLYRVQSTSGQITIRSDNESVRRLAGLSTNFANVVSSTRPVVQAVKQAQFSVDSNSVQVNQFILNRSTGASVINVSLTLS